jgi:DNA-binding SARP family transcriptional activator
MAKGGAKPGWPVDRTFDWRKASEFIQAGQYEQVAEILREAQAASEQVGDEVLAGTLAAACQICLACSQYRAQVEWHQQVCEDADQRERDLRHRLRAILDLANHRIPPSTPGKQEQTSSVPAVEISLPERGPPKPVARPSLGQRARALLSWRPGPRASRRGAGTAPPKKQQRGQLAPSLTIYCLGPFRAYNNEHLVEKWPGHKCKSIFKYMIIHREHPIHLEILMDLFWRDVDPEAARRNLYQAVYSLRQALQTGDPGFPYILCEDGCYDLNPDVRLWVDSDDFTAHYQTGQQLEREGRLQEAIREYELADNLYEGEFLAEDRYEDWSLVPRENLKHAHLDILDRLSQHYFGQAQFAMCIAFCQKILAEDNCREDAHRRLMRCHLRQGQRHLALRQYHMCVEALKRELDVPPMPATVELYQEIQRNRVQFPDV